VQHFILFPLDVKFAALQQLRREILDLLLPVDKRLKLELILKLFDLQFKLIFGSFRLLLNRTPNPNLLLTIDSAVVLVWLVLFGTTIYLLKKSLPRLSSFSFTVLSAWQTLEVLCLGHFVV